MKVTVQFFGDLVRHLRNGEEKLELEVEEGTTVGQILQELGLEEGEVFATYIDDQFVNRNWKLEEGGRVLIFPPIAGG